MPLAAAKAPCKVGECHSAPARNQRRSPHPNPVPKTKTRARCKVRGNVTRPKPPRRSWESSRDGNRSNWLHPRASAQRPLPGAERCHPEQSSVVGGDGNGTQSKDPARPRKRDRRDPSTALRPPFLHRSAQDDTAFGRLRLPPASQKTANTRVQRKGRQKPAGLLKNTSGTRAG